MTRSNDPSDPAAWLSRARSDLSLAAKGSGIQNVYLEDLCYHAQQAAEKALKALCVLANIEFPKTHSLVRLMDLLQGTGVEIPEQIKAADVLTHYAVETRYPGFDEEILLQEYQEAYRLAESVVFWAEEQIIKRHP